MSHTQDFSPTSQLQQKIIVNACKFDGSIHRSWECDLVEEDIDFWTFVGTFKEEIRHPLLGVIRPGTVSVEFYWKKLWYNVFRFHEPEGGIRNFYCNINMPPVLNENILTYIDLDIDVLVEPDLSYRVVDLEEFAENAEVHKYPPEIIERAKESLSELILRIEKRQFPFDYNLKEETIKD